MRNLNFYEFHFRNNTRDFPDNNHSNGLNNNFKTGINDNSIDRTKRFSNIENLGSISNEDSSNDVQNLNHELSSGDDLNNIINGTDNLNDGFSTNNVLTNGLNDDNQNGPKIKRYGRKQNNAEYKN